MISEAMFNGIAAWHVEGAHGSAWISPHGGQLLSWRPRGHDEVFWCSPITRPPQAIRGGVPVCWPYFGRQGQASDAIQHGHARLSEWQWIEARETDDGIDIELVLPDDPRTPLRVRQHLHFAAGTLRQMLITRNPSASPVHFTQALHSYFAVGDACEVSLDGLDGDWFEDKVQGGRHPQHGPWTLADALGDMPSDRIYTTTGDRFVLRDPGRQRRVTLETSGSRSLVVWNPRAAGTAAIADLPADGWRQFVCVETANAGDDEVLLVADAEHRLQQRIRVSALD